MDLNIQKKETVRGERGSKNIQREKGVEKEVAGSESLNDR